MRFPLRLSSIALVILTSLLVIAPSSFANTTTVWEPVNIAGPGTDTMADGTTVTVSFGDDGSYSSTFANVAGGDPFFYLSNNTCTEPQRVSNQCGGADLESIVRFTFDSVRTSIKIHVAYVESFDPQRIVVGTSDLDSGTPGGGTPGTPSAVTFTDIGATNTHSTSGVPYVAQYDASTGVLSTTAPTGPPIKAASASVELTFSTGIKWIEFQNDWPGGEPSGWENYGANLVGLSVPVEYGEVSFDANGGTGTMSAQSAASETNLTANTFTRDGFSFAGWNTAANGSGTSYSDEQSYDFSSDVSLFAQWTPLSGSSSESSTSQRERERCHSGIFLTLTGRTMDRVTDSPLIYGSCALNYGAPYLVTIQPLSGTETTRTVLGSGIVPQSGAFERTRDMPSLSAGNYKIVMTSTHPLGHVLTLTNHISVSADGRYATISAESLQPHLQ